LDAHGAEALAHTIVALLEILLPCHFCRDSWPVFVRQLEHAGGRTVAQAVRARVFARFVFDAHNLVNDKLLRQRWSDTTAKLAPQVAAALTASASAVPDARAIAEALVRAAEMPGPGAFVLADLDKRPTFECVQKRHVIAGARPFAPASVWRVLLMFSLNFSSDKTAALVEFMRALASGVLLCDAHFFADLAVTLRVVAAALEKEAREAALTPERVFERLAMGQAACEGVSLKSPLDVRAHLATVRRRVNVAAAGACLKGVCK
jgi:hypothetical protein